MCMSTFWSPILINPHSHLSLTLYSIYISTWHSKIATTKKLALPSCRHQNNFHFLYAGTRSAWCWCWPSLSQSLPLPLPLSSTSSSSSPLHLHIHSIAVALRLKDIGRVNTKNKINFTCYRSSLPLLNSLQSKYSTVPYFHSLVSVFLRHLIVSSLLGVHFFVTTYSRGRQLLADFSQVDNIVKRYSILKPNFEYHLPVNCFKGKTMLVKPFHAKKRVTNPYNFIVLELLFLSLPIIVHFRISNMSLLFTVCYHFIRFQLFLARRHFPLW